jgi:hypothetical protein
LLCLQAISTTGPPSAATYMLGTMVRYQINIHMLPLTLC